MTSPAPGLRSRATSRSSTMIDAQAESASSSARNRLVSLRPKVPAGRIVAVSHAVSDTAAAGPVRARTVPHDPGVRTGNAGLLNSRTVPIVTSSRPTVVVDRSPDCRPLPCEPPVAPNNYSSESLAATPTEISKAGTGSNHGLHVVAASVVDGAGEAGRGVQE